MEQGETLEECCIREVWEETGYQVKINEKLHIKEGTNLGISFKVHYFLGDITGGYPNIQDPDGFIYDIRWVSYEELKLLNMSFPEDRQMLMSFLAPFADMV